MQDFLEASPIVDWGRPEILSLAEELAAGEADPVAVARRCFVWVRDRIKHSGDFGLGPVTCEASQVLRHGTGFCYAKSHLLAALLRANEIPAGFCYQRLRLTDDGSSFCLHGLNAAYLPGFGWYRFDARGDRPGVATAFDPPVESLAFEPKHDGEATFNAIFPAPLQVVVEALTTADPYLRMSGKFPDLDPTRTEAEAVGEMTPTARVGNITHPRP